MPQFEAGTYDLSSLLQSLSGKEVPSSAFLDSIRHWRDLKSTSVDLGGLEDNKFIRGLIHEQSAEKLRPFVEILCNSIDAGLEVGLNKPDIELVIKLKLDGSYVIEISDKGIGPGMTSEVFIQKFLPPSASTKGQLWSSSIGQMGVGANQQYGLLMREGDDIFITTTVEAAHSTIMNVRPCGNNLLATVASGTVPSTHSDSGLDKQGTMTRITLSKETAEEIGFSPNNLIGYLADRFGNYKGANLTLRLIGTPTEVDRVTQENRFNLLTPNQSYARALEISSQRAKNTHQKTERKSEVVYSLTQEFAADSHYTSGCNLADNYLIQDTVERYKTTELQVSKQLGSVSLVYLSVLGMRFGEPLVIDGNDIPATIDINLDYRIGQISESRSDLRLGEFDYLRVAALIGTLTQQSNMPNTLRLKIALALVDFCAQLDKKSPNKLRYDINLSRKLGQVCNTLVGLLDKSQAWPSELAVLCSRPDVVFVPAGLVGDYVFDYEILGFCTVKELESNRGHVFAFPFPENERRPFLWTEQTVILNQRFFPNLHSENQTLRHADIVKVLAVQHNITDEQLSTDSKMPMEISFVRNDSSQELERSHSEDDYDHELWVSKEFAQEIRKIISEIKTQLDMARINWVTWSLEEKQRFISEFVNRDHDSEVDLSVITHLGLTTHLEVDAFFPIFLCLIENSLQEHHDFESFETNEMVKTTKRRKGKNATNSGTLRTIFNLDLATINKQSNVSWLEILRMFRSLRETWLATKLITNSSVFFESFFKLTVDDLEEVNQSQEDDGYHAGNATELFAKKLLLVMAQSDVRLVGILESVSVEVIEAFFVSEIRADTHLGLLYLYKHVDYMYDLFYFYLTEGSGFDPNLLKILFYNCNGSIHKLRAALWISGEHNLSSDDIHNLQKPDMYSFHEQTAGKKALSIFLHGKTQLGISDGLVSNEIAVNGLSNASSVGELLDPNSSELALRRVLQNVNSVEPGLGGSVHEAIKNAVQAINRARVADQQVSNRIIISDFMEVNTDDDRGKYGFGFRINDEAGWQDANEALTKLTTPGVGEGLHSVHFLTLLKEYDLVRARVTDRQGKTALIEYRKVVDSRQHKVTDILVRHMVIDSNHKPGTIIEGVKWSDYPEAESSIFRTSIDYFARNVPKEEAEIVFDDILNEGSYRNLNTTAETIISPNIIGGFGAVGVIRTSREWYAPEVSIEHVPVKFNLIGLISSASAIPKPYQELLISSGFTINISAPQIAIIRSTLEFKDQVWAQKILEKYLSENWQQIFMQLVSLGQIDLVGGDYLTRDCWYDSALFSTASQNAYEQRKLFSPDDQWLQLTDRTEVGAYLYYEPLIVIENSKWSIARIIADQYLPIAQRQLAAEKIPPPILQQIRAGKERIKNEEIDNAQDTIVYVDAPSNILATLEMVTGVVRSHVENTDGVRVLTHRGRLRGINNNAFHHGRIVSFNLDTMLSTIERASQNDFASLASVLTICAHELEHDKRREDESPFSHTRNFYRAVESTLIGISSEQIGSLI